MCIEKSKNCVKSAQNEKQGHQNDVINTVLTILIVDFEQVSHIAFVFLLLTLSN